MYRLDAIVLAAASMGLAADLSLSQPKAIDRPARAAPVAALDAGQTQWAPESRSLRDEARDAGTGRAIRAAFVPETPETP